MSSRLEWHYQDIEVLSKITTLWVRLQPFLSQPLVLMLPKHPFSIFFSDASNTIPLSVPKCSSTPSSGAWTCPKPCACFDGIADCRNKKLTKFPKRFPREITEM